MIIQANETNAADFPRRFDQIFFLIGLLLFALGQGLLAQGRDFISAQTPIDWAHWSLLIGALCMLPFVGRLPRRNLHLLSIPLLILGIAAIVGMNVIDFIAWSLPPGEFEDDVFSHLIATDVIWLPFIRYGPNEIFIAGLLLPTLSYFRVSRLGTALVYLGFVVMYVGPALFNMFGYLIMTAGYFLNFNRLRS